MEAFEDLDVWVKWTQTPEEQLVLNLRAEIEESGYALVAFRSPNQHRVIGTTLGLSWSGHPEIVSMADDRDDVFALLKHLVDEVLVHDRIFEQGSQSTTFFKELRFRDVDLDLSEVDFIGDVLHGVPTQWIQCQTSMTLRLISAEETKLVSRNVA